MLSSLRVRVAGCCTTLLYCLHLVAVAQAFLGQQTRKPRIVGGVPASTGFPSFGSPALGSPDCGCTLIHPNVALSAAHCRGSFLGQVIFFGGTRVDGADAMDAAVAIHEVAYDGFDYLEKRNDIMLVQLDRAVRNVPPAPWNTDHNLPNDDTTLVTMGFGDTHPRHGQPSNWLLQIAIPVVPMELCSAAYNNIIDSTTMICAGDGQKDACRGDSGNPLLDPATGVVVGVVSWGWGCGSNRYPGVYTRVSAFDGFIRTGICYMSLDDVLPCYCDDSCVSKQPVGGEAPTNGTTGADDKDPSVSTVTVAPVVSPIIVILEPPSSIPVAQPNDLLTTKTRAPSAVLVNPPTPAPIAEMKDSDPTTTTRTPPESPESSSSRSTMVYGVGTLAAIGLLLLQ